VQRVERTLVFLQVIVAGLACGVIAGLAIHVVVAEPALLTGTTPAFAGSPPASAPAAPASGSPSLAGEEITQPVAEDPARRLPAYARERYHYATLGRRDPFQGLVGGDVEADGDVGLPDVADLRLVGIAWDAADRFAMAEDSRGYGYVLRVGDKIRGGKVARIARDKVTFAQYTAGELSSITLELTIRED